MAFLDIFWQNNKFDHWILKFKNKASKNLDSWWKVKWKFNLFFESSKHPWRIFLRKFFPTSEKIRENYQCTQRSGGTFQVFNIESDSSSRQIIGAQIVVGYLHIIMSKSLEVLMVIVFSPKEIDTFIALILHTEHICVQITAKILL